MFLMKNQKNVIIKLQRVAIYWCKSGSMSNSVGETKTYDK